ncbi:hypothetical protein NKW84_14700 [Acetobacter senegalensis]|uniref:hypothetical protein n=1 Tax=Acetobacter senegalensis TaxID=446692 RepID=UPI00209F7131|nr:hypothetical protein [Acetobacter senegalensis]MCP1197101.1 hypothetical protein [Acetobacter senegalensis]
MTEAALTGAALIASAYPARYYAQYDRAATGITLVTGLVDVQADDAKINTLPAAADMTALTPEQWALAQQAPFIHMQNGKLVHPARYYASFDLSAAQPTPVLGWYDTWAMSNVASVPAATDMISVSARDWADITAFRKPNGRGVQDGKIIDYTPPVPLSALAQTEQGWIQQQESRAFVRGQKFTAEMLAYADAIEAIADGTDTTSTKLRDRPTNIMS